MEHSRGRGAGPALDKESLGRVEVGHDPEITVESRETPSGPAIDVARFVEILDEYGEIKEVEVLPEQTTRKAVILDFMRNKVPKELLLSAVAHGIITQQLSSHVDFENGKYTCIETEEDAGPERVRELIGEWRETQEKREAIKAELQEDYKGEIERMYERLFPESIDAPFSELIPTIGDYATIDAYSSVLGVVGVTSDLKSPEYFEREVATKKNELTDLYSIKLNELIYEAGDQFTGDVERDLTLLQEHFYFGDYPFIANGRASERQIIYNKEAKSPMAQIEYGVVNCTVAQLFPVILRDVYKAKGIDLANLDGVGAAVWEDHVEVGLDVGEDYHRFSPLELAQPISDTLESEDREALFLPPNHFVRSLYGSFESADPSADLLGKEWTERWFEEHGEGTPSGARVRLEGERPLRVDTISGERYLDGLIPVGTRYLSATESFEEGVEARVNTAEEERFDEERLWRTLERYRLNYRSAYSGAPAEGAFAIFLPRWFNDPEETRVFLATAEEIGPSREMILDAYLHDQFAKDREPIAPKLESAWIAHLSETKSKTIGASVIGGVADLPFAQAYMDENPSIVPIIAGEQSPQDIRIEALSAVAERLTREELSNFTYHAEYLANKEAIDRDPYEWIRAGDYPGAPTSELRARLVQYGSPFFRRDLALRQRILFRFEITEKGLSELSDKELLSGVEYNIGFEQFPSEYREELQGRLRSYILRSSELESWDQYSLRRFVCSLPDADFALVRESVAASGLLSLEQIAARDIEDPSLLSSEHIFLYGERFYRYDGIDELFIERYRASDRDSRAQAIRDLVRYAAEVVNMGIARDVNHTSRALSQEELFEIRLYSGNPRFGELMSDEGKDFEQTIKLLDLQEAER